METKRRLDLDSQLNDNRQAFRHELLEKSATVSKLVKEAEINAKEQEDKAREQEEKE